MADPLPPESDESPSSPVERPSDPAAEFRQSLEESLLRDRNRAVRRRVCIIVAAALGAVALVIFVWRWLTPPPVPKTVRELAAHYARDTGLDVHLVLGVIQVESAGQADAVSRSGARGLMQLMPKTATEVAAKHKIYYRGPDDLFDPALNVQLGTLYLAYLHKFFKGDLWLTVAAYNCGITRVDRLALQNPQMTSQEVVEKLTPGETQSYVPRVLAVMEAERRRAAEKAVETP